VHHWHEWASAEICGLSMAWHTVDYNRLGTGTLDTGTH